MKWISVGERVPEIKDGINFSDTVLIAVQIHYGEEGMDFMDGGYVEQAQLHHSGIWLDLRETPVEYDTCTKVTHWMPLPKPPEKC